MLPLTLCDGELAPSVFKPLFLSTSPSCPAAIYLYNCLCGLEPSSATDTYWLIMFFSSFFPPQVFFPRCDVSKLSSSASPPRRRSVKKKEHPLPWIYFSRSISFLCIHVIFIYILRHIYATELALPSGGRLVSSLPLVLPLSGQRRQDSVTLTSPRGLPDRLQSTAGVAPSIGYLLLLTVCPPNKMAACCFYSSDTGGGGLEVR